jgi:cation transport regulator ChaB
MPYATVADLPAPVRERYSAKCARAYMHAANSSFEDDPKDEGKAARIGHTAAQQCEKANRSEERSQLAPELEPCPDCL